MKTLFRYIRPYLTFALLAPALMLIEVFMDLMLPTIMARIIDEGIVRQDLQLVLRLGSGMLLATAIAFLGGGGCSVMATYVSTGLGTDLRNDIYRKIMGLSYKNLDTLETGNLVTRLTHDVSQIEEITRMMLRIMIRAPLQITGSLVMAIAISPSLSLSFIVLIPLLLGTLTVIIKRAYPLFYKVQSKLDTVNTRVQENLAGKRLIKAFVRESCEENKFSEANNDLMEITTRASRTIAWMHPGMQLILNSGIIIALWYGARIINLGALRLGALIAFLNYLRQLLFSLMMFSNLLMRFSRAQASSTRIQEVLDTVSDIQMPKKPQSPVQIQGKLEFRNVSFSYSNNSNDLVLDDISFTILPGQTLALLGETGAGKTTLANLVPRFYDVCGGGVFLDGTDVRELSSAVLKKAIAIVPQSTTLFSGSIRDNILYHFTAGLSRTPQMNTLMRNCAAIADVNTFIEGLPEGYDTEVSQKGANFSGGQKQRIAIARALAKRAPVLILDDSTSSVDMETEKRIQNALASDDIQRTVIIIAQRISRVMSADIIVVLEDGRIAGTGTHQQLLEGNAVYRDIYNSQIDTGALR